MSSIAEPLHPSYWRYPGHPPVLRTVLLVALLLHMLLLLIPARKPPPLPAGRSVAVDFRFEPAARPSPSVPDAATEPVTEAPQPIVEAAEAPPRPEVVAPVETTPPHATPEPRPPLTTAWLLEQARNLYWQEPAAPARIPGVPYIPDLPQNLTRPVLPLTANAFDEEFLSGEQEILDQWMEPNGVINAVIKLPNGDILCGRAEPWDMMNPLVEPVAMYRSCAGGGKRSTRGSPFPARD